MKAELIDRQRAIESIDKYYNDHKYITRSRTTLSAICKDLKNVIKALPSAEFPNVKNNTVCLCNSCAKRYPECEAQEGVMFGDGQGQDNICCCNEYLPLMEHDYIRGGFTYN